MTLEQKLMAEWLEKNKVTNCNEPTTQKEIICPILNKTFQIKNPETGRLINVKFSNFSIEVKKNRHTNLKTLVKFKVKGRKLEFTQTELWKLLKLETNKTLKNELSSWRQFVDSQYIEEYKRKQRKIKEDKTKKEKEDSLKRQIERSKRTIKNCPLCNSSGFTWSKGRGIPQTKCKHDY